MLVRGDILERWHGEQLGNGLWHQPNVEELWSESELNEEGLHYVIPFIVPEGKEIVPGSEPSYTLVGNKAQEEYPVQDIAPAAAPTGIFADAERGDVVAFLAGASAEEIRAHVESAVTDLASTKRLLAQLMLAIAPIV